VKKFKFLRQVLKKLLITERNTGDEKEKERKIFDYLPLF